MPNIGFSRPYVAKYAAAGSNVVYSDGMRLGRGVSVSMDIESSDGNDFYADNAPAESVRGAFTGGSLTLTIAELNYNEAKFINGLIESSLTIDSETINELVYSEDNRSPSMGVGYIKKKMYLGATKWIGVVIAKVAFDVPSEEVNTQEDEVDWQTQDIEGSIEKDVKGRWKFQSQDFDTEEEADAYIRYRLGMAGGTVGNLDVVSTAGSTSGYTEIAVDPALTSGNQYVYLLGTVLELPSGGEDCTPSAGGYTDWDGTSEIPATTGQEILVVEVNSAYRAQKAGIATVTSA